MRVVLVDAGWRGSNVVGERFAGDHLGQKCRRLWRIPDDLHHCGPMARP
jgi:hypothetical protein